MQPWFEGGFDQRRLYDENWHKFWLFIHEENIAPVFIGEWGGFLTEDNIRFFTLFSKRAGRLFETTNSLLDYTSQIRDDYEAGMADKQNHIMTILTVVTTIFMPLTLITGWYGMNFKYMPELDSVYGYPTVIAVSLAIAILSLVFFKYKKWL